MFGHRGENLKKEGYTLTPRGIEKAKEYIHLFATEGQQKIQYLTSQEDKSKYHINLIAKVKNSKFYKLFLKDELNQIEEDMTIFHVADFLGTSTSNIGRLNKKYVDAVKGAEINDETVLSFLKLVQDIHRDKINDETLIEKHLERAKARNKTPNFKV